MPIYEYECENCGEVYEFLVTLNDGNKYCPKCGKKLKKIISLSNFKLVGDGWYQADYNNSKIKWEKENAKKSKRTVDKMNK